MKKYLWIQCKRTLRLLPLVLCVAVVLFGSLAAMYYALIHMNENSESQTKFQVGLVGTAGDSYLQLGLAALESFDSSRFAIEIVAMTEPEAEKAMERGDIAAYVAIPEGFLDAAFRGDIIPLKYVSTTGAVGLVTLFKDEITMVINDILTEAQKGIYGVGDALQSQGLNSGEAINELSIEYVEFVFARSKAYTVRELGLASGLGLEEYMLCGLTVLFFMLICLPFAPLLVHRDHSLGRMLAARRKGVAMQVLCEFVSYLLGLMAILSVALLCAAMIGLEANFSGSVVLCVVPVVLMVAAFSFLLYELTSDLISGVLLQFFATLCLCFISGCLYPNFFFPEIVQKIAAVLPAGLARVQLAGCITGEIALQSTLGLLGYGVIFFAMALLIRLHKVKAARG